MARYTSEDIARIREAYRLLLPTFGGKLSAFWNPEVLESWACLTTPLEHDRTPEAFMRLDAALDGLVLPGDAEAIGDLLAKTARECGVGYSFGLNPWADFLLYATFDRARTKRLVVVIAHNWNPIVKVFKERGRASELPDSPIEKDDPRGYLAYGPAIAPLLAAAPETAVLFLNLFPHFKAAGEEPNGPLNKEQMTVVNGYEGMREAMGLTLEAISPDYRIVGVISWGRHVWEALAPAVTGTGKNLSLRAIATRARAAKGIEELLALNWGGRQVPYLPYVHPSSFEWQSWTGWEAWRADYERIAKMMCDVRE